MFYSLKSKKLNRKLAILFRKIQLQANTFKNLNQNRQSVLRITEIARQLISRALSQRPTMIMYLIYVL